jgi:hypothetical protein
MVFLQNKILKALCYVVAALYSLTCYSQTPHDVERTNQFLTSEFVNAKENAGLNAVPTFHQHESTRGFQYFSRHWLGGVVIYKDTQIVTAGQIFLKLDNSRFYNFDKFNNNLVSTQDGKNILNIPYNSINGFILIDSGKAYIFKKNPAINKSEYFQSMIESDNGYSLYKRTITKLNRADYQNIGYGTTGKNYDEYVDLNEYYLVFPDKKEFKKLSLNISSIEKTLKANSAETEEFFEQNQGSVTEEVLYNLILFLNNKQAVKK